MSEFIVRMPPDMPYEIRVELNAWYVESEPIVRCRDCKWSVGYWKSAYCDKFAHALPNANLDGFCAWGERKEVG